MSSDSWVVRVYHIAVPCGDGAIYLLCKRPSDPSGQLIVHNAVLIDGGRPMDEGRDSLLEIISIINEQYDFSPTGFFEDPYQAKDAPNPTRSLRFDAIVITHWDEDHHLGVQGLLADGYERSYKAWDKAGNLKTFCSDFAAIHCLGGKLGGSGKKRGRDEPPKGGSWPKNGALLLPCWYCKYDIATLKKKPEVGKNPEGLVFETKDSKTKLYEKVQDSEKKYGTLKTTLYVPCSVSPKFAGPFRHGSGDSHRYLRNAGELTNYKDNSEFACFFYNYDKRVNQGDMKEKKKGGQLRNDPFPPKSWSNHLVFPWFAKLEDKYSSYIGTNLFTGAKLPSDEWEKTNTLADLVTKHKLGQSNPLAFFIVAGHQRIIGSKTEGTPLITFEELNSKTFLLPPLAPDPKPDSGGGTATLTARSDDDEKEEEEEDFRPSLVEEKSTKLGGAPDATDYPWTDSISKNAVSVTTMVVGWKKEAAPDNHEVLHFGGGDVDWDVEGGLATWLAEKRRETDKSWVCRPKVWKLNHHGSRKETAVRLLNVMYPDYFVCSSSEDGEYGHPSPETVLMIWAQIRYFKLLYKDKKDFVQNPWMCTAYPKWLESMDGLSKLTLPIVNGFRKDNKEAKTKESSKWFQQAIVARTAKSDDAGDKDPFEKFKNDMVANKKKWAAAGKKPAPPKGVKEENYDGLRAVQEPMQARWREIATTELGDAVSYEKKSVSFLFQLEVGEPAKVWGQRHGIRVPKLLSMEVDTVVTQPSTTPPDTNIEIESEGSKDGDDQDIDKPILQPPLKRARKALLPQDAHQKIMINLKQKLDQVSPTTDGPGEVDEDSDDDPEAEIDPMALKNSTDERSSSDMSMAVTKEPEDVDMGGGQPTIMGASVTLKPTTSAPRALPARSRPVAALTVSDEPPGPYLLVSNAYRRETFHYEATRFAMLTNKTVLDMLVRRLPSGFIVVARKPNTPRPTTTEPLPSEPVSLLYRADKWARCLVPGPLGIASIGLTCLIDQVQGTHWYSATVKDMTVTVEPATNLSVTFKASSTATSLDAVTPEGIRDSKLATDHAVIYLPVVDHAKDFSLTDIITMLAPKWLKIDLGTGFPDTTKFQISADTKERSGLYLLADNQATACMRLDFNATSAAKDMLDWLKSKGFLPLNSVEFDKLTFTVFQQGTAIWMDNNCLGSKTTFCQFTGSVTISRTPVEFRIRLKPGEAKLSIRFPKDLNVSQMLNALGDALDFGKETSDLSADTVTDLSLPHKENAVDLGLYRVDLVVGKGVGWSCTATMRLKVLDATFITSVTFPNPRIRADLWTDVILDTTTSTYLPWFDDWTVCMPTDINDLAGEITLKSLNKDIPDGPDSSFLTLREAHFEAAKRPGGVYLDLYARIDIASPQFDFPMMWPKFFSVHGVYDKTLGAAEWRFDLNSVLYLPKKASDSDQLPAQLELTASISNTGWTFIGTATHLDFMSMYTYFDQDANDTILDLLSGIAIPWISLQYDHRPTGPSTLSIDGALQLKKFELDFNYFYSKAKGEPAVWQLKAGLGAANDPDHSESLLDIITAFLPNDSSGAQDQTLLDLQDIPFFKEVSIQPSKSTSNLDPITFSVSASKTAVIMWLRVELATDLATISVLFAQYKYKPVPGGNAGSGPRPRTANMKRFIRVRFDKLPTLHGVPIVGQIPSPVDAVDYVYVKDNTTQAGANKAPGLTPEEIAEINLTLDPSVAITFKEQVSALQNKSKPAVATSTVANVKPALRAGHHFIVMSDGATVLDHIFGGNATSDPKSPGSNSGRDSGGGSSGSSAAAAGPTQAESGSTYGAQKKTAGGLSITGVGIKVKESYLYILIDGSLRLGPIEVAAEGLGIGLPLGKIVKPKEIEPEDFKLMLSGLGVMYNQPPILIAGGFKMDKQANYEQYIGGLVITIPPYSITAVGAYRRTKSPDFKSVFIYGRLNGPLFTIGFAEVSGVAISFGYNYTLRSPSAADVENFPLLSRQGPAEVGANSNPLDMIIGNSPSSFSSWLQAEKDTFYFSVGLKADACQVLTVEAVLIFALGGGGLKASLVGRATAQMPPAASKSPVTFVYAELGIVASIDSVSFVVQAQLSSNSFVLTPSCRIRGGFALAFWYGTSPYAGDWVFSVGGYHPAFKVPGHWPNPPRLSIAWEISDELRVGGEGYFAITPKAVMGGAHIFATFNAGLIYADFEAWASFLLNYKPLFFVAEVGLSITVGARINLGLIHIDIHGTVSADLYLRGPPFGGYVKVDFKLVHFKIYFGPRNVRPKALTFDEFADAVAKPGLTGAEGTKGADEAALVVVALSAGAATETQTGYDQKTGERWSVRAGALRFRIESKFAVGEAFIYSGIKEDPEHRDDATALNKQPIYGRLTQNPRPLKSTLTIKVSRGGAPVEGGNPWRVLPSDKALPKGMWAQYSEADDPTASPSGNNTMDSILSQTDVKDSTISHVIGYHFVPPAPIKPDPAATFPEFNAVQAMSEGVFSEAHPASGGTGPAKLNNPLIPEPQGEKRPHLPPAPAGDGTPPPGSAVVRPDLENEGRTVWHEAEDDKTQDLADWVSAAYGWAGAPVVNTQKKALDDPNPNWKGYEKVDVLQGGSLLRGQKPGVLLGDFDRYYMSYPWVAEVVAAH